MVGWFFYIQPLIGHSEYKNLTQLSLLENKVGPGLVMIADLSFFDIKSLHFILAQSETSIEFRPL